MVSYEAACTMLMELVPIVADNKEELALLLRGKEELRSFFEKETHRSPPPSTRAAMFLWGRPRGINSWGRRTLTT